MAAANIDTRNYLEGLRALAARYPVAIDLEAVPSIQEWCKRRNIREDDPFRCGRTLRANETGRFLVLLADPITADMVSSAIGAMVIRRYATRAETARISEPQAFLVHLMLHEIAHALDNNRSEYDCDRWAFEQLDQLPSNWALNVAREIQPRAR